MPTVAEMLDRMTVNGFGNAMLQNEPYGATGPAPPMIVGIDQSVDSETQ